MSPRTILLVEDNPDDEALILMALRKIRVADDIVIMRDGKEVVDYLFAAGDHAGRDAADLPAVILLDLKLPKLDGLDVLKRIRAEDRTKLQPVVIFTSSDEDKDRLKSYALGVNSYVCKPVDSSEFDDIVHSLGLYWLRVNKPPQN